MGYDWLVPLAAAIANLLIGVSIFWRGSRVATTRAFAWMTATLVLWNLDIFALYYFADEAEAEYWSRIFRTGILLSPAAVFHSTLFITGFERDARWRRVAIAGHTLGLMLAIVALFPHTLVETLTPHRWGWYPVPSRLYSLFSAYGVVYLVLSIVIMWRRYRAPLSSRQRLQIQLFFFAGLFQVPFALTNLLPVYGINIYPLGNLGNVVWTALIAYAIVRHRFMDLDYVVRKVVSFLLSAGVVLIPAAFGVASLSSALGVEAPLLVGSATVAVGLLAAILIPTLQRAIETKVHQAIFAHRYDYRLRLRQLSSELVHVFDERQLVRRLGDQLIDVLELETATIYVRDDRARALVQRYPDGDATFEGADVGALEALTEPMLMVELEAMGAPLAARLAEWGWEVVFPLRVKDRLIGLVGLGRNRDLRIVSREDLHILEGVASGASVAIENARLSRELRRSETALERANRLSSIGTLAAGIAHEIRNPLTAVKTFLDLLPQRLDDPEFVTSFRELSLNELKRVTNLITELLAFGKSTSTERRLVELDQVLDQVVRLLDSTARKRQVVLRNQIAAHVPAVWADADQIKQIVLNLVLNAIDASAADSIVTLALHASRGDTVMLEVRDQGSGIPPEQLESVFHPFFTTKEQGTGLGLSLVHQMVVEHGGEIGVDSEVGRGSVFRVTLPIVDVALRPTGT
jgi:signal transduction histidine kinase